MATIKQIWWNTPKMVPIRHYISNIIEEYMYELLDDILIFEIQSRLNKCVPEEYPGKYTIKVSTKGEAGIQVWMEFETEQDEMWFILKYG